MVLIEKAAWETLAGHARQSYPAECCGALLGRRSGNRKRVTLALRLENAFPGPQRDRYAIRPEDLLEVTHEARRQGLDVLGIYHSHPDCEAYFSPVDLKNSCPWYSFVVLSVRQAQVGEARCYRPNREQTGVVEEKLVTVSPRSFRPTGCRRRR